jgi:hypothetical protein
MLKKSSQLVEEGEKVSVWLELNKGVYNLPNLLNFSGGVRVCSVTTVLLDLLWEEY